MSTFEQLKERAVSRYEELVTRPNQIDTDWYNGCFDRYVNPVVTAAHIPLEWRYDFNPETNPFFMERLTARSFNCSKVDMFLISCLRFFIVILYETLRVFRRASADIQSSLCVTANCRYRRRHHRRNRYSDRCCPRRQVRKNRQSHWRQVPCRKSQGWG